MMPRLSLSFQKHRLYSDFLQVKARLQQHQFICWVAGGAVRDLYLGREVYDFDLVTDASTENLKIIFPEAIPVGESFGVLKIPLANGEIFDLATFRQESDYIDGRRPSAVSASTPPEDAKRRDFTVNALFWDDENQNLIDYVDGVRDLQSKRLICVGDAIVRFSEDHLRIVRLLRFSTQLKFSIEPKTEKAALALLPKIKSVSGERIWIEFKKLAIAQHWDYVLSAPLFKLFIREIFNVEWSSDSLKIHNISKAKADELEDLYFILAHLSASPEEVRKVLTTRLKLSKAEITYYDLMIFALAQLPTKNLFEITLLVEKRPELKKIIQYLSQLGILDANLAVEVERLLALYPEPLLKGNEISMLIQGPQIGQALDEIRVQQFQGQIFLKEQAMQLIVMKKS